MWSKNLQYLRVCSVSKKSFNRLLQSVGAQWDGMIEYSSTHGNLQANDTWIQCNEGPKWFESNCTVQEYGQMSIWEPCNYASNLAYYHTVTEICARQEWNLPEDDGKSVCKYFFESI